MHYTQKEINNIFHQIFSAAPHLHRIVENTSPFL